MRTSTSLLLMSSIAVLSWTMSAAEAGHKDGYSFKNGKVVMMKDGKESLVTVDGIVS